LFGDASVRVRQQDEAKLVGFIKHLLSIPRIGTDPHHRCLKFFEFFVQISEVATLFRSPRRESFGVEKQYDGTNL